MEPRLGCTPITKPDNPHYSPGDVSGHASWEKGTCSNDTARAYNCLYEFYTDNSWRQKVCSDSKVVAAGGGTGAWVTTRIACTSTATTSWRNQADVDVIGEVDTGGTVYNQKDVACRVN